MKLLTDLVSRCRGAVFPSGKRIPKQSPLIRHLLTALTVCSLTMSANAADVLIRGIIKREVFNNATRLQVEANTAGSPSLVAYPNIFEMPVNAADNYAQRVSGVFIPPTTGNYVFFLSSDDDSDLFLSTDANPATKRLIAQEAAWSNSRQWTTPGGGASTGEQKRSDQFIPAGGTEAPFAAGIPLVAGQQYYIESVHAEGGGGDNLSATYKLLSEADPENGDVTRLTGDVIAVSIPAPTQLTITNQPQSRTFYAGTSALFTVGVSTDSQVPPQFQWRRNGTNLSGATGPSYSFTTSGADTGATFDVIASVPGITRTSTVATLTVPATGQITMTGVKQELWDGASRQDVESGRVAAPTFVRTLPSFEAPVDFRDNYSQRLSTTFTPTTSGNYVFFISSDDDSDLFISTDANPVNKRLIAQETDWSAFRSWTSSAGGSDVPLKRSDTFSPDGGATTPFSTGIPLVAGQRYYLEAVHHEGSGGDNLAVTYKLLAEADPVDDEPTRLTGSTVSFTTAPATTLTISTQPRSITVAEGTATNFTVVVQTDAEISPTFQWRTNGVNVAGATNSSIAVPRAELANNNTRYSVVVTIPGFTNTITSSDATLTVESGVLSTGFLLREVFPNSTRPAVEGGTAGVSTNVSVMPSGESPANIGDNYASRVSGYFIPPTTGDYVFFVAADDDTDLFLSTDADPANKKLIAQEASWSNTRAWNTPGGGASTPDIKRSDQFPTSEWPTPNVITLTAGQRYYMEAVHHDGTGGDHVHLTFKLASEADPADGTPTRMTGTNIAFLAPRATLTFTRQPQSTNAVQGQTATFTVAATSNSQYPGLNYQWFRNGAPISGANSATYTTGPLTSADNNAQYTVQITGPGVTATSSQVATLTVTSDQVPPTIVSVTRPFSGANNELTVTFSEPVSAATGGNYTVNNGATVTGARFGASSNIVILTVSGLNVSANNQVTVTGVQDLFGNPIAAGAQGPVVLGMPSVLFVVSTAVPLNSSDAGIRDRLRARGFPVEVIQAPTVQTADADRHDLVIVSSTVTSGDVAAKFAASAVPVISWEQAIQDDMMTTGPTDGTDRGSVDGQTALTILNSTHPLAAGQTGTVTVVTAPMAFSWGLPVAGATRIASIVGTPNRVVIYGIDTGTPLFDGTPAPERRVHMFLSDAAFAALNAAGLSLFDAAVNWAAGLQAAPSQPRLQIARSGGNVTISWQGTGFRLQESTNLTSWSDVPGATTSPVTLPMSGPYRFFRLIQ